MKKISYLYVYIFAILMFSMEPIYSIVIDSSTNYDASSALDSKNVIEVAQDNGNLSTFVQMVRASDLLSTLEATGPYTVFAPSNDAFSGLSSTVMQELFKKENKTKLTNILKNHIVKGKLLTSTINSGNITSLGGKPLYVQVHGSLITINGASIVEPDLNASNGLVQVIDKVFLNP